MADCTNAPACGNANCPATLDCLVGPNGIFNNIVHAALIFIGTVVVILIIFAGYKFITSGGDSKQIEGARKAITYAIIGLLVVLLSFFIINLIATITGVTCLQNFGFSQSC